MKKLLYSLLAGIIFFSCSKPPVVKPVIISLGTRKVVYTDDFKYAYKKSLPNPNPPDAFTEPKIREYVDLYSNFKLKVLAAEIEGIDTTRKFKKELEGYRKQLAKNYLRDTTVLEKLAKEVYERLNYEVKAQHILLNLAPDAIDADTATAFNRMMDIRKRIVEGGEDFEKVAREISDDPSAKKNGGNLGYFTAMQMVYPFESAAYKTAVGTVSMPVRTSFGYHLIKVLDKRPAQGEITVAHILIRAAEGMSQDDLGKAETKIKEIHDKLTNNTDTWENLVRQFSEEPSSAKKGGALPPFTTGKMQPAFEDAAFALKDIGQISSPVKTPYGWHIIKLLDFKGIDDYDKMRTGLLTKVQKDSRSELNRTSLIKKLKVENMFKEIIKAKELAFTTADNLLPEGTWDFNEANKTFEAPLFTIGTKPYSILEFLKYVRSSQVKRAGMSPRRIMEQTYSKFTDEKNLEYEESRLEVKNDEFRRLIGEYKEGMLLFEMMDKMVWSKSIEDTSGLRSYWIEHKDKYQWKERLEATIYSAIDSMTLARVIREMEKGRYYVSDMALDNIYYDFAKFTLRNDSKLILDKVASILNESKDLTMDVEAHTDSKGTDQRNMNLSKKRAESARDYIVSKGIDKGRVNAIGFGETKLLVADAKTNEEHQKNRRSTFSAYSSDLNALVKLINKTSSLNFKIMEKKIEKGDDELSRAIKWEIGSQYARIENRWAYVVVKQLLPPMVKTFEEAKGEVTTDYQKYLEDLWLEELRKAYPPIINEVEVKSLVKQPTTVQ